MRCQYLLLFVLLILLLAACRGGQSSPQKEVEAQAVAKNQEVWVSVEGPWAYAEDSDKSKIVLIAPRVADHTAPFAQHAYGEAHLAEKMPSEIEILNRVDGIKSCSGTDCALPYDAAVKVGTVDRLKHLGTTGSYIVRLPRPDDYWNGVSFESRVGTPWTEVPAERDKWDRHFYTIKMLLHYTVTKLDGFKIDHSLYGFQGVRHNEIAIAMTPNGRVDCCDRPSRKAFKDLVDMLGLEVYADFPSNDPMPSSASGKYDPACWKCDPQNPNHPSGCTSLLRKSDPQDPKHPADRTFSIQHNGSGACRKAIVHILEK